MRGGKDWQPDRAARSKFYYLALLADTQQYFLQKKWLVVRCIFCNFNRKLTHFLLTGSVYASHPKKDQSLLGLATFGWRGKDRQI
jgi:hypothetical protein